MTKEQRRWVTRETIVTAAKTGGLWIVASFLIPFFNVRESSGEFAFPRWIPATVILVLCALVPLWLVYRAIGNAVRHFAA